MNDLWKTTDYCFILKKKEVQGILLALQNFALASSRFMIVINARYIFLAPMSQLEIFSLQILLLEKTPQVVALADTRGHHLHFYLLF